MTDKVHPVIAKARKNVARALKRTTYCGHFSNDAIEGLAEAAVEAVLKSLPSRAREEMGV